MRDKLILTDCDGVLLDWEWSFTKWLQKHGKVKTVDSNSYKIEEHYNITEKEMDTLVHMFHETVYMANMAPLRDAVRYVKGLHEDLGYVFHVITSAGSDPNIARLREQNLHNIFGKSVFHEITCVDGDKFKVLSQYKDSECLWVEDHPKNYYLGLQLGLDSVLMTQYWNIDYVTAPSKRVNTWKEIYEYKSEPAWM